MSLIGALNVGQSALAAQQAAIQVTGNNIANAGSADYARQTVTLSPATDQQLKPGVFVGDGVDLAGIQRQVDDALDSRLRGSVSDNAAASTTQQWLSQVEQTFNALGTSNLSTSMASFFSSWSNLANKPQDTGLRQVVLQQGDALAQQFQSQRQQLSSLFTQVGAELSTQVQAADNLASQIASLNGQIVNAKAGTAGNPNDLLDQRDAALKKLSQLMNVSTVAQPNGSVNVYVGSEPLVYATTSSGVAIKNQTINGIPTPTVVFKNTGAAMPLNGGGQLGALGDVQARVTGVIGQVDALANNLIFAVNKLHASGQGLAGISSATATNAVTDPTAALNAPAAGLKFAPNNGSFVIHVQDKATGLQTSTLVQVNLTGSPADTTLNSLAAQLNAINGVKATISGGRLTVAANNPGDQLTFSQDSSGALAALGINSFFAGTDASNVAVNATLSANPQLLAAARNGDAADNQTALAMAALASQPIASAGGQSLNDQYQAVIDGVATQTAAATTNAQAAQTIMNTLQAQRDSLSGTSLDEEAVNLIKQQQAYLGAAKLVTTIETMMQAMLAMVQ